MARIRRYTLLHALLLLTCCAIHVHPQNASIKKEEEGRPTATVAPVKPKPVLASILPSTIMPKLTTKATAGIGPASKPTAGTNIKIGHGLPTLRPKRENCTPPAIEQVRNHFCSVAI